MQKEDEQNEEKVISEDVIVTVRWSPSDPNPQTSVSVHAIAPVKPTALEIYNALGCAQARVASGLAEMVNGYATRVRALEATLLEMGVPAEISPQLLEENPPDE